MTSWHRIGSLLGALALLPATAMADDDWYMAAYLGQAHLTGGGGPAKQWIAQAQSGLSITQPPAPLDNSDNGIGSRLTVGYVFNWYWGLEGGYVNLSGPTATGTNTVNSGVLGYDYGIVANASLKTDGWTVVANVTYPLVADNTWALYGRAGVFDAHTSLNLNTVAPNGFVIGTPTKPANEDISNTSWKSTYGIGVKVALDNNWSVRLGWDRYPRLGNSATGIYSINLASLGMVVRF